jgi:hypothetical protein
MLDRKDKQHDIAAFFGVNGGRIADISTGKTFPNVAAYRGELPPPGPYNVQDLVISRNASEHRNKTVANEIVVGCADMERAIPAEIRRSIYPVFQRLLECAEKLERPA